MLLQIRLALAALALAGLAATHAYTYRAGHRAAEARWERASREAAERFAAELQRQQQILIGTTQALQQNQQLSQSQKDALDAALQHNADWAGQPVPDGVRQALSEGRVSRYPGDPD